MLLVAVLLLLCTVACGEQPETAVSSETPPEISSSEAPTPKLDQDVRLGLMIDDVDKRRPVLTGSTNLPDGTRLMTSVQNESSGFRAQDSVSVDNGRFKAGPFGPAAGLQPGTYIAEAFMPLPRVQSDTVRSVIGENGEHLLGPLVQKSSSGVTVSVEREFSIGSRAQATEIEKESNSEAKTLHRQLEELVSAGRAIEDLRHSDELSVLKECGDRMRAHQAQATDLRSRADSLSHPAAFSLRVATTEANLCVSCLPSALENCDQAEESLKGAGESFYLLPHPLPDSLALFDTPV